MRRGFSPAATAAFITTLLVLAVVGWSIGWLAAGTDLAAQHSDQSPSPTPVQTTKSATPSRTPSASPSASPSKQDTFAMPNLVGKKFRVARQDAFDLKLGVTIHFEEPGPYPAGTVVRTSPSEKVTVWPGISIILYVTGAAPNVSVPVVAGKTCDEGKDALIDAGLRIESYPSGNKGKVVRTDPAGLTIATWNDQVKVYCSASP